MKTLKLFLFIALAATLSATMGSCKKDGGSACEQLKGEWRAKSWTIDGTEVIGTLITSSIIEFGKLDGNRGNLYWDTTFGPGGQTQNESGKYEVNKSCTEITFIQSGEAPEILEFDINKDKLTLEGISDGYLLKITFDRK